MTSEVRQRAACAVLGLEFPRMNPMTADWQDIWGKQYAPREPELLPYALDEACYGVYFGIGEEPLCDLVTGKIVALGTEPLPGTVVRAMPAALEAVFESTMDCIGATWQAIFSEWMPTSGYAPDEQAGYCYERYAPGATEGQTVTTIHVPVRKVGP